MKIIYAEKSTGIEEDGSFQNPKYFESPGKNATSVVIYGDYPEIEAAYQALGVEVEVREVVKPTNQITVTLSTELAPGLQQAIDDAKAECEKVQAENAALNNQVAALSSKLNVAVASIETLEAEKAAVKKPTAAELKAAKAAEEAKAAEQQPQE